MEQPSGVPQDRNHRDRALTGRIREALRRESNDLDEADRMIQSDLVEIRIARSDGTADDEHDPEGSTLSSDWSRLDGLSAATAGRRAALARSVARLDAGTYGICVSCGRVIGEARLEVRPTADYCIDCARDAESHRPSR